MRNVAWYILCFFKQAYHWICLSNKRLAKDLCCWLHDVEKKVCILRWWNTFTLSMFCQGLEQIWMSHVKPAINITLTLTVDNLETYKKWFCILCLCEKSRQIVRLRCLQTILPFAQNGFAEVGWQQRPPATWV